MKVKFLILIIFLGFSLKSSYAQEQEEPLLYHVKLVDGNEFTGEIISENEESIRLKTEKLGEINISRKDIRSIQRMEGAMGPDGKFWLENTQATRYFWAPNGYGLKEGEGYYQNVWVLFNQASVGLSDHVSIGAGVVPLFLFAGTSTPFWLTPKFSVPLVKDEVNVGGGALVGTVLGESDAAFGILYGTSTFGSRDQNISLGMGYGFAAGSWARAPMVNVSGIIRTGKNGYLLTENYYIQPSEDALLLLSIGGRRMIRNFGLDFGAFVPFAEDIEQFIALPWLGFSVSFGETKKATP